MLEEGYFGLDLLERLGIHVGCPSSRRAIFYASYRTRTQRARSPHLASTRARKTALTDAMKIPKGLQPLIEDGIVDEVVRSLKSGKEANIYIVRSGAQLRCAKVYRDLAQRSFQRRAQYQEGRKVRGSRETRAMAKSTRFGRKEQEHEWKNAEVDALYRLVEAGLRVPKPFGCFNGVLLMELVTDAQGDPAPRLGEVELSADAAREHHDVLVRQIVGMLSLGLIHGDLSEFNVLLASHGPVIIDLPQVVNAAGNNAAFAMLERDTNNIRSALGRFAPELLATEFAAEMWEIYEQGELRPQSELSGVFRRDDAPADAAGVMRAIDDAREEAIRRTLARDEPVG
jgi:RIO kinase 1